MSRLKFWRNLSALKLIKRRTARKLERSVAAYYISANEVIEYYAAVMRIQHWEAADQLRNLPGLESAVERPRTYAYYRQADLSLQAAALAHAIAEGQLFIDGNKRTAQVAMLTFLELNGYRVSATDKRLVKWIRVLSVRKIEPEIKVQKLAKRIRNTLVVIQDFE